VRLLRLVSAFLASVAALLVLAALGSALVLDLSALLRPLFSRESYSRTPAFAGIAGVAERFREYEQLETEYQPFVGWRYRPFRGATITLDGDGLRLHPADPADPPGAPVLGLFGGSVAWGMGVTDAGTLPAALDRQLPGIAVRNLAQIGYNSLQSLALLIERLRAGDRLDSVVLFQGVNDVASLCMRGVSLSGHGEEPHFRRRLSSARSRLAESVLGPIAEAASQARRKLFGSPQAQWTCDGDPAHAGKVAEAILTYWEMAHDLSAARGIPLVAALQPVAWVGRPNLTGLDLDPHPLGDQFAAVYPLLRERIAARGRPWILDLSEALEGGEPVYFDFCHLTERGNQRLAAVLAARLGAGGS
jgi:hypothetical protein